MGNNVQWKPGHDQPRPDRQDGAGERIQQHENADNDPWSRGDCRAKP